MIAAQGRQAVDGGPVRIDLRTQDFELFLQLRTALERFRVRTAGCLGRRRQELIALGFHGLDYIVAIGSRQLAQRVPQCVAQVIAGKADGLGELVRGALFDPEQTRNSHVLRRAAAPTGKTEPQQLSQVIFGFSPVQVPAVDAQLASLLAQERLAEPRGLTVELELNLHRGRRGAVAPRTQATDRAGLVPLEEGCSNGFGHGGLARLVRRNEQVQSVGEVAQFQGRPEAFEVLDSQPLELHAPAPRPGTWSSRIRASARIASRASSGSVPACCSRSSCSASPTKPSACNA